MEIVSVQNVAHGGEGGPWAERDYSLAARSRVRGTSVRVGRHVGPKRKVLSETNGWGKILLRSS